MYVRYENKGEEIWILRGGGERNKMQENQENSVADPRGRWDEREFGYDTHTDM